jgi:hypothetical protein
MKVKVVCLQDYQVTAQLGELQVTSFTGEVTIVPTPPQYKIYSYNEGQELTFSTKKAAKEFIAAYPGKFRLDIPVKTK